MKKLPIITYPDPRLRQVSRVLKLAEIATPEFKKLSATMIYTMHKSDGIGLAAPQIGQNIRLTVIGKNALREQKVSLPAEDLVVINPEILEYSWKTAVDSEACLSVPGASGEVQRHTSITVRMHTTAGAKVEFTATNYLARVLQHEIDHLNGVLFVDRATDLKNFKK